MTARFWTNVLAGEFFLRIWPNGGTAIFVRTLWITTFIYTGALLLRALGYTNWSWGVDFHKLGQEMADTITWLGAIAGAVYTALYARFSSQWSYLANVYHQIKSAQVSGPENPSAEQKRQVEYWMAAFVEDAEDLHLVRKKMFAMTAWEWLKEDSVANKFDLYTVGGKQRRIQLQETLKKELLQQDPTLQLDNVAPTASGEASDAQSPDPDPSPVVRNRGEGEHAR